MASLSSPTASSSASDVTPTSWDVFLSFRGSDTRYNFVSHLYSALDRHRIRIFMDDPELRSGEPISDALLQAIHVSKICIVVLSENYASSRWCLEELAEILDCHKTIGTVIIPVYYNIYPIVVRNQIESFQHAFEIHERRFETEKVHKWRKTLKEVAGIIGYLLFADRSQADIIKKVVDRVLLAINPLTLYVAKYPVGLDSRAKKLTAMLSSDINIMASSSYDQTSASPASFAPPTRWDVFLCYRGSDTRYSFTDFLYDALHRTGIQTFMASKLSGGEIISNAVYQAIQESKTYIVVFSENYASSTWCLDELTEIHNCHKTMKRLVIPVFYNIDPSVVRHQIGIFQHHFEMHKTRQEMRKINSWRLTLTEVAGLSGYDISGDRSEADVINEIVERILPEIDSKTLNVAKYPVGLHSRVKGITPLLSSGTRGVVKLGIFGMVGVGKTTLAKFLYNQLLPGGSFRTSCFIANVREISGTVKGLESLQQKLINDVLRSKKTVEVDNVEQGTKFIKDRICSAKVLVLIDDIDDLFQYESLVGPFASGSVVIITTRNEEILDKIEVETRYRYRVKELDEEESLVLFTKHAFGNAKPENSLMELSKDILRLASGLPLALEVFGSYLYKRSEVGWKYYIEKLQLTPNNNIQQKLTISLDALESDDPVLKEMFLDIACFFIGRKKEEVVNIMETHYSYTGHIIDMLNKRCLLTIDDRDVLGMHDLLADTGREIARNRSPNEPGKHSRLWVSKDISAVLRNYKGTEAIEGIIPNNLYYPNSYKGVSFDAEAFKNMSKLRFLYLKYVNLTGGFEQIFKELRWLCWECCPLKSLPSDFYPQKLVFFELPHSEMRAMWDRDMVSNVFEKLKTLNMKYSLHLTTTPDFTKMPSLEILNLEGCESLEEVHTSIGSLVFLVSIILQGCVNLKSLPGSICSLRAVKSLNIGSCSSLEALPVELGNIESLTDLNLERLTVSNLPDSLGRFSKLVELNLSYNKNLETISELPPNLKHITADGCRSMERLPNLSNVKQLEILKLTGCTGLTEIHGLMELNSLRELHFRGCNSSLLAYTLTKRFFQILSRFGHRIDIYTGPNEFPYWISQPSNLMSTMSLDLPPNESENLLGMILCLKHLEDSDLIEYSVENTTSGFILQVSFHNDFNHESLMVIVPTSIFPVMDGDYRIKLRTTNADIFGIHLLYKQELTMIDESDSVDVEKERATFSKRMKHCKSDN